MTSLVSYILNKHIISFCLGAAAFASCSRLFDKKNECILEVDSYGAIVCDLVKTAFSSFADVLSCEDPPSTKNPSKAMNLAHLLNSLDATINVKPRWDVMEDAEALYLVRDMSGLDKKDVKESMEFPSGDQRYFDYRMNIFGFVRTYRMMQYPSAILVIKHVGLEDPKKPYYMYTMKINLPGKFYKTLDVKMIEEDGVFKITIPKEKGKWIREITYSKGLSFVAY